MLYKIKNYFIMLFFISIIICECDSYDYGDINSDDNIDIIDVMLCVDIVFDTNNFFTLADLNFDNIRLSPDDNVIGNFQITIYATENYENCQVSLSDGTLVDCSEEYPFPDPALQVLSTFDFNITPVNDNPVMVEIPDQIIQEEEVFKYTFCCQKILLTNLDLYILSIIHLLHL